MIDCSVILCCYNGKQRLRPTLEHLAKQKVEASLKWELIFVDNASTDDSAALAEALWKELGATTIMRVVRETKPGLIFARKAGVEAANGKYILFCDDDNWLKDDYLQKACELMEQMPNVGAVGGQGIGVADMELPKQWKHWAGDYACGKIMEQSGICEEIRMLFGAGLVVRKELLNRAFAAPLVSVGRDGDKLTGGDDQEICYRVMLQGYHLYYDERLVFKHYMPEGRLNEAYHSKMIEGFLAMVPMFEKYRMAIAAQRNRGNRRYAEWMHRVLAIVKYHGDEKYKQRYRYYVSFAFGCSKHDNKDMQLIKQYIESLKYE
jgi:glycosyltransferase involved in cell wall biosynthesis